MTRSALSNSAGFERCVMSPVWIMKEGFTGSDLTLPIASWSVPITLGLAGLSKPIWLEKAPPKRRNRVVVGMLVRSDEPERHRIIACTLKLAAGKHPRRIAVNQNAQQQRRMVGSRARASIAPNHCR